MSLVRSYQPYGKVLASDGSGVSNYGFTGEWTDSYIDLLYLRSRMYSPSTGRFLTKDSWQGEYTRPASYNRWLYGYANPIKYTDPSGNNPLVAALVPALVGLGVTIFGAAAAGGIYGYCTYELAIAGQCGCKIQQQALSMSKWEYAGANALAGGLIGATAIAMGTAAAATNLGAVVVGGIAVTVSLVDLKDTVNIIRNETGPTWCTITRLLLDVAGLVFGAMSIAQGVRAWLASGRVLERVGGSGVGVIRPQYSGPSEGWPNLKPTDLIDGYNGIKLQKAIANGSYRPPSNLVGAPPILRDTAKFIYVIDDNGTIWVTRNIGSLHHPDLVNGSNVYGAGEMYINQQGQIALVNDLSGHYQPNGSMFFAYLENILEDLQIIVLPKAIPSTP